MSNVGNAIKSFTDLDAWKESHKLVIMVYQAAKDFPKDELFGLTIQIKRAVISVTSNIAEGFSRYSHKEKLQFYYISLGSLTEVQNQLLAAKDLGYCVQKNFMLIAEQSVKASKILNGLIKKTKTMNHAS